MNKQTIYSRDGWPAGPWRDEPDRVSWRDEATGLDCLMKRHEHSLHWCGYVGVPGGHPWNGKGWDDVPAEVHGGVTYTEKCDGDPTTGICHVPAPGQADDVWWIGFDCMHSGDCSPMDHRHGFQGGAYRDEEYVRREVESLARQAAEAALAPQRKVDA